MPRFEGIRPAGPGFYTLQRGRVVQRGFQISRLPRLFAQTLQGFRKYILPIEQTALLQAGPRPTRFGPRLAMLPLERVCHGQHEMMIEVRKAFVCKRLLLHAHRFFSAQALIERDDFVETRGFRERECEIRQRGPLSRCACVRRLGGTLA